MLRKMQRRSTAKKRYLQRRLSRAQRPTFTCFGLSRPLHKLLPHIILCELIIHSAVYCFHLPSVGESSSKLLQAFLGMDLCTRHQLCLASYSHTYFFVSCFCLFGQRSEFNISTRSLASCKTRGGAQWICFLSLVNLVALLEASQSHLLIALHVRVTDFSERIIVNHNLTFTFYEASMLSF